MPEITIYSGTRKLSTVKLEQVRLTRTNSLYGPSRRISVDLFGGRVGETTKLGMTGSKESMVAFLKGLVRKLESAD